MLYIRILFFLFLLMSANNAIDEWPIKGIRIPLKYNDRMQPVAILNGKEARIIKEGVYGLRESVIIFITEAGETNVMSIKECKCDIKRKFIVSEDKVSIEGESYTIFGKGIIWDGIKNTLEILSDVRIVIKDIDALKRINFISNNER